MRLLVREVHRPPHDDVQDVWRLFAMPAAGAPVAALGISLSLLPVPGRRFWPTLGSPSRPTRPPWSCWHRSPCSAATVRRTPPTRRRRLELAAQMTPAGDGHVAHLLRRPVTLGFAPLPVIVWAAVRFSERTVVLEQVAYATAVTLFTQYGCGPVLPGVGRRAGHSTQHAQLYLICLVLIGLPLAKAMRQHDDALTRSRRASAPSGATSPSPGCRWRSSAARTRAVLPRVQRRHRRAARRILGGPRRHDR